MPPTPTFEQDAPATESGRDRRRATMRGSRLAGLLGFALGVGVGAIFDQSLWISGVIGFIVFAELPDLVYRRRARRASQEPLLPPWSASEAYIVTLRRWRRSRHEPPG